MSKPGLFLAPRALSSACSGRARNAPLCYRQQLRASTLGHHWCLQPVWIPFQIHPNPFFLLILGILTCNQGEMKFLAFLILFRASDTASLRRARQTFIEVGRPYSFSEEEKSRQEQMSMQMKLMMPEKATLNNIEVPSRAVSDSHRPARPRS